MATPADFQAVPAAIRDGESPGGSYRLSIETQARRATATLYDTRERSVLWQRPLPQELGPRVILVGRGGTVILLDEWINIFTDYAIMVIDKNGNIVAQRSTDEIASFLSLTRAELAANATFGPWMRGEPALSADGGSVVVPMGAQSLVVDLADGSLSRMH